MRSSGTNVIRMPQPANVPRRRPNSASDSSLSSMNTVAPPSGPPSFITHLRTSPRGTHWLPSLKILDLGPALGYLDRHVLVPSGHFLFRLDVAVVQMEYLAIIHVADLRPDHEVHGHNVGFLILDDGAIAFPTDTHLIQRSDVRFLETQCRLLLPVTTTVDTRRLNSRMPPRAWPRTNLTRRRRAGTLRHCTCRTRIPIGRRYPCTRAGTGVSV